MTLGSSLSSRMLSKSSVVLITMDESCPLMRRYIFSFDDLPWLPTLSLLFEFFYSSLFFSASLSEQFMVLPTFKMFIIIDNFITLINLSQTTK